jgi:two-component system, OmpR family, response regulator
VDNPKILLFNEDIQVLSELSQIFERANYWVTQCDHPADVIQQLNNQNFDLLILDIPPSTPARPSLLDEVRRISRSVPILILTGTPCLDTALFAIRCRAYDYLFKSISTSELLERAASILEEVRVENKRKEVLAQIQTLLGQLQLQPNAEEPCIDLNSPHNTQLFQQGLFSVNCATREVLFENRQVNLPPTEINYLVVLLRHQPNIVSHKTLVSEAQGYKLSGFEAENLARWHIHTLRKCLRDLVGQNIIETIRGSGYRINLDAVCN